MSFWNNIIGGAVNGAVASAATPTFESLANHAGWTNYAANGDGKYVLYLNVGSFGMRQVLVNWGQRVASFAIKSDAAFTADNLKPQLGWGLLMRNAGMGLGAWDMREVHGGYIGFVLSYTAIIAGLDAAMLKVICEGLCEEVYEVDQGLRSKGLI